MSRVWFRARKVPSQDSHTLPLVFSSTAVDYLLRSVPLFELEFIFLSFLSLYSPPPPPQVSRLDGYINIPFRTKSNWIQTFMQRKLNSGMSTFSTSFSKERSDLIYNVLQQTYIHAVFFIRTSKFWPSLIVLKFFHNLSLNCSYF